MLKKFSVVGGWCGRVIIVSALSLSEIKIEIKRKRERETELDNLKSLWLDFIDTLAMLKPLLAQK